MRKTSPAGFYCDTERVSGHKENDGNLPAGHACAEEYLCEAPRMSEDDTVRKQLATCLFEAEQLLKLNQEKHREPVSKLYQYIQAGKYYASVSTHLSTGTTDTLTPMYQYKINDACNTISQLLLSELKQGGVVTGKR